MKGHFFFLSLTHSSCSGDASENLLQYIKGGHFVLLFFFFLTCQTIRQTTWKAKYCFTLRKSLV